MAIGDSPKIKVNNNENGVEDKEKKVFKILLAEDDHFVRESLEEMFLEMGYEVEVVENGRDLFVKLQTNKYDIVFTDNSMPFLTGIQVLKKIRSSEKMKNLPVIVFSGDENLEREVREAGGIYIGKPAKTDRILSTIRKALREVNDHNIQ
ncbi:MAG: response regulator [Candidatus Paceibacterota bacterium]